MLRDRDRPDTGATAAVRDAERLVQVEVRDVATELARCGVPEQRVEVGAVDVDLAAVAVHDLAQLGDAVLVDAVRRRVRHHDRGEVVRMRIALRLQVLEVDLALIGRLHDDDAHAGHDRRSSVGAVRRRRDQAHVAVVVAAAQVVRANRQQPGELALRAGVGLDRHGGIAGDLGEPRLERLDELDHPGGVLGGHERVQVGEPRPADGLHLGGRVELHGARAERDHAAVERVVAVAELAQVAQHLRLAVVLVEHRVRQDLVRTQQRLRQRLAGGPGQTPGDPERVPDRVDVGACRRLARRDADMVGRRRGAGARPPREPWRRCPAADPGTAGDDGVEERRHRRPRRRRSAGPQASRRSAIR